MYIPLPINWIWPPMSLTKDEKVEEWKGRGLIIKWFDGSRTFFPAKSREHWAAMKRFYEQDNKKTGRLGFGKAKKREKSLN